MLRGGGYLSRTERDLPKQFMVIRSGDMEAPAAPGRVLARSRDSHRSRLL